MIKQPQMVRRSNLLFHNMGFHQIINEVTLVLGKPLSYIDLIFTSQTNMVVDSGVCIITPKLPASNSVCKI